MIKINNEHGYFELKINGVYEFDVIDSMGEPYPLYDLRVIGETEDCIQVVDIRGYSDFIKKSRIAMEYEVESY